MKNSLYITGSFEKFSKCYIDAKINKTPSAKKYILEALDHCFESWQKEFINGQYEFNINLTTLFSLLAKDNKPSGDISWKINCYKDYLNFNSISFKDHLIESLLMHLAKETKVYPSYTKDYKLLYFIAREIKYSMFKIIRKICQYYKRNINKSSFLDIPRNVVIENINIFLCELDFLFYRNRLLYSVVLTILTENSSWKDIQLKYSLNKEDFKKIRQETHIWISSMLLNS